MQEINVDAIMEEIRKELKEKGIRNDIPSFEEVASGFSPGQEFRQDTFFKEVESLNQNFQIVAWRPLEGGIKGFLKKIIRKLTKFYVEPIALDQTEFNAHSVRAFNQMVAYVREQDAQIEFLKQEIENLKSDQKKTDKK